MAGIARTHSNFAADYHDWRSRTVIFLSKLESGDASVPKITSKLVFDIFGYDTPNGARTEVADIVQAAMDLDLILRKSRAKFSVSYDLKDKEGYDGTLCHVFQENHMEIHQASSMEALQASPLANKYVEMKIQPALVKQGNADGGAYDHSTILSKMLVTCGLEEPELTSENIPDDNKEKRSEGMPGDTNLEPRALHHVSPMNTESPDQMNSYISKPKASSSLTGDEEANREKHGRTTYTAVRRQSEKIDHGLESECDDEVSLVSAEIKNESQVRFYLEVLLAKREQFSWDSRH